MGKTDTPANSSPLLEDGAVARAAWAPVEEAPISRPPAVPPPRPPRPNGGRRRSGGAVALASVEAVSVEDSSPDLSTGIARLGSTAAPDAEPSPRRARPSSEPNLSLSAEALEPDLFDAEDEEDTLADLMPMDFDGEPAVPLASLQGPRPTTHPRLAKDLSIPRASLVTATGSVERNAYPQWPPAIEAARAAQSQQAGAQVSATTVPPGGFAPAPVRWVRSLVADLGASKRQVLRGLCIGIVLSVAAVPLAQLYWHGSSPAVDWLSALWGGADDANVEGAVVDRATHALRSESDFQPSADSAEAPSDPLVRDLGELGEGELEEGEVAGNRVERRKLQSGDEQSVEGLTPQRGPSRSRSSRSRSSRSHPSDTAAPSVEELEEPTAERASRRKASSSQARARAAQKRARAKAAKKKREAARRRARAKRSAESRKSKAAAREPEDTSPEPVPPPMSPAERAGLSTDLPF